MEQLRFLLLVIGIIFVIVVYLWEILHQPKTPSSAMDDVADKNEQAQSPSMMSIGSALTRSRDADFESIVSLNRDDQKRTVRDPETNHAKSITADDLLIIYLESDADQSFSGESIYQACVDIGMHHGKKSIFHYHDDSGDALFSMANGSHPGTLELETIMHLRSQKLAFFMYKSVLYNNFDHNFDIFFNKLRYLASYLNGHLKDTNFQPLNDDKIQILRSQVFAEIPQ